MTDHQLQEQLLKAEIPAPIGAWEQINAVLDEDAEDAAIQHQLNAAAIPASQHIWAAIEQELNWQQQDEALAGSLTTQELQPPPFIWENVESALNENSEQQFAEKLLKAEVEAPAAVWPAIEEDLHPKAKVIPIGKRFSPLYRYAAAAVIIGMITWGAFQLLNQPNDQLAAIPPTQKVELPATTNDSNNQSPTTVASTQPIIISSSVPDDLIQQPKRASSRFKSQEETMPHDQPSAISTDFSETNYLLVVDEKGDLIRVSKKLSTMDCVKNNEMPVDAVTALQVKDCENKIKKLQQKLATSVLGGVFDPNTLNADTEK